MDRWSKGNHVLMHAPAQQRIPPKFISFPEADLLCQEIETVVVALILLVGTCAGLRSGGTDVLGDGAREEGLGFFGGRKTQGGLCGGD